MKKLNIYSSIISLTITLFLFICVCLAWYTNNKQVEVSDIGGSIVTEDNLKVVINCYYLNQRSGDNYVIGNKITALSTDGNGIDENDVLTSLMRPFNSLDNVTTPDIAEDITGIFFEIELTSKVAATYSFIIETQIDQILNDTNLTSFRNNYLSNAISIYQAEIEDTIVSYKGEKYEFYSGTSESASKTTSILINEDISFTSNQTQSLYLYIDYDGDKINYLYEQMLKIFGEDVDLSTSIYFKNDLTFKFMTK